MRGHWYGCGSAHDPAQVRDVVAFLVVGGQHEVEHGGYGQGDRDAFFGEDLPDLHRVEFAHNHPGPALVDDAEHWIEGTHMKERQTN